MALVNPAPCSFNDVLQSPQRSSWSAPIDFDRTQGSKQNRASRCSLTPASLAAGKASTETPKLEFLEGFASLSVPRLDVSLPLSRISGEDFDWYTVDTPPATPLPAPDIKPDPEPDPLQKKPFHRWIRSLHRRTSHKYPEPKKKAPRTPPTFPEPVKQAPAGTFLHPPPLSASGSSLRFVSAVRSASVSLASVSAVTRPRKLIARSRHLSRTDRSSRASLSVPRVSEDSVAVDQSAVVDAATTERSIQRRQILEELITTEEAYIGDVRFLIHVYVTLLASLPLVSARLKTSIKRNLADIVELHEEILTELHKVVPHSRYSSPEASTHFQTPVVSPANRTQSASPSHRRWRSMDAVREQMDDLPLLLQNLPSMTAEPQVVADVSKIFAERMNKFFIYEEYGSKYEILMRDFESANKTLPEWESYQRGFETLASTLGSVKGNDDTSKKALTISDLLVKPIQRVCKYPLLFAELLKFTPVCDCPSSHMAIDTTLIRLRETTSEINHATNDLETRTRLEKTWVLRDRLVIPNQALDAGTKCQIRSLGRVRLCGVLHICWQTTDTVDGRYMICLLYDEVLCLATTGKIDPVYTVLASIHLGGTKIEEIDNGRGLQCHTAPFSWKLSFERDCQLYEIMLTACSSKEETEWRSRLVPPTKGVDDWRESPAFTSLELDIKSLGNVFGKPGTVARRLSIHRATTVGSKTPLCQVVLKNTSVARDGAGTSTSGLAINRSQSLLTTNNRLPVLTPSRADRARLEGLMSDIWSREVLPFPSMAGRTRSEHLVRASSVMRKLSVTSLTGSFGKRSGSSLQLTRGDTWERSESCKPKSSLEFEGCISTREYADDEESVRKLTKPRPKAARRVSRADIAKLGLTDRPRSVMRGPQFATIKGIPRASEDSAATGASVLEACSVNDGRSTSCEKPLAPVIINTSKENVYTDAATERARNSGRWTKVGMARTEAKVHGFRSLFR